MSDQLHQLVELCWKDGHLYERIAERRAAELIEQLGVPVVYDEALNLVALAYLEGGRDQLKWARDQLRGDGE